MFRIMSIEHKTWKKSMFLTHTEQLQMYWKIMDLFKMLHLDAYNAPGGHWKLNMELSKT